MITALLILAAIILSILIVAASRPADFRYARQAVIPAPPAVVFPLVNDLTKWPGWSPWQKLDPAMQQAFEGPVNGVGAVQSWSGNNQVGSGRITITDSQPDARVELKLEFFRPFVATNRGEFTFAPEAGGTCVTWSMEGRNNFIVRVMGLFMNMDKMVGGQFEEGLANLGRLAGSSADQA